MTKLTKTNIGLTSTNFSDFQIDNKTYTVKEKVEDGDIMFSTIAFGAVAVLCFPVYSKAVIVGGIALSVAYGVSCLCEDK